ncbi:unnamed protein product, partial [Effrenium voratum]
WSGDWGAGGGGSSGWQASLDGGAEAAVQASQGEGVQRREGRDAPRAGSQGRDHPEPPRPARGARGRGGEARGEGEGVSAALHEARGGAEVDRGVQ